MSAMIPFETFLTISFETSPTIPFETSPTIIFETSPTIPFDLNLCLNPKGETVVPYKYFVAAERSSSTSIFPRFLDLPNDIELVFYDSCDAPTLWQLMRTSSRLRTEASKRFWALSNVWYHCDPDWWYALNKNRPGLVQHCPDFAERIEQVEISAVRLEMEFRADESLKGEEKQIDMQNKARRLWEAVERSFPSVKTVVLTGQLPMEHTVEEEANSFLSIALAVGQAPAGVTVLVAFETHEWSTSKGPQTYYRLWRVDQGPQPSWQVVEEFWTPKRVLLPFKKGPGGPLGDYESMLQRQNSLQMEERGLRWLISETYVRYSPGSKINCPNPNCDSIDKHEWQDHTSSVCRFFLVNHHATNISSRLYEHTPAEVVAGLQEKMERMSAIRKDIRRIWLQINDDWGTEGTEKRRNFETTFFAQLRDENYLTPGEAPEQSPMWEAEFLARFDPTHIYYSPIAENGG